MTDEPLLTLNFPWPRRELSPNGNKGDHWSKKANATKSYRSECILVARAGRNELKERGVAVPLSHCATMRLTFVGRRLGVRDYDNLVSSFKAGQDTMTTKNGGAGVIQDDSFKYLGEVTVTSEPGPTQYIRMELW